MSAPNARLFEEITAFIAESRKQLADGKMVELSGLEQCVQQLCEETLHLSQNERLSYTEPLQRLFKDLSQLGQELQTARDEVRRQLNQSGQHSKASKAYSKTNAVDGYGKNPEDE